VRRTRRAADPRVVTEYIAMFGVSTVEQAQKRLAEEDERLDMAKALGIQRTTHESVVYYMRMDRLVKIGMTTNICARVGAIMPQGVLAVEWGGRLKEHERHVQFAGCHSHLEWFWMREPLWEHIVGVRAKFEAEQGVSTEAWLAEHHVHRVPLLDQADDLGFT